jgi:beta-galactosidase/beta-glucuronidase
MLRPQDTSTRERKSLNGLWKFPLDKATEGRSGRWFAQPLRNAREMAVPASFNDIAADATVRGELTAWVGEGKPIIITEYGADTYPGLHSVVSGNPWTEEYQVEYLDMNNRVFDRIDAVVGEQMWNFADFATTSGIMRVSGNKKGAFTLDRQPKAAAHALIRRWREGP